MKFVHLAYAENIPRIQKIGLRMGGGDHGRGVYAAPLFHMPKMYGWNRDPDDWLVSHPVSSGRRWKWWLREKKQNGRACAVVFGLPERFWPVDVYLYMTHQGHKLLKSQFPDLTGTGYAQPYMVREPAILGQILHCWRKPDDGLQARLGISIEVVVRQPVPPDCIERIVPLYRTNKKFKKQKEAHCDEDSSPSSDD